jgi:Ca-activated chloride channel family protein
MTQFHPISFQLRADGLLLAASAQDPSTLLFDVSCPAVAADTPPAPIAVMLAVDVSGSMNGAKLDAVREAASRLVAGLGDGDLLGLCAFDETARLLLPISAMNADGRHAAASIIHNLRPGGSTALCAGWRLAADELVREDARFTGRSLHVVVLSDGMGNHGVTDPGAMAEFSLCLALRGIATSSIGVGDDWSTAQLEALAIPGGGRLHHAIQADEIAALLEGEVRGMQFLGATGLELALALPQGVAALVLAPEQARIDGMELRIRLGALPRGGRRTLPVRVAVAPDAGPGPWVFEATLSSQDPATRAALPPLHALLRLDPAASPEAARTARDAAAVREVAEHWLADATRRVLNANREGAADVAAFTQEAAHFSAYCRGVAGTERLVKTMSSLAAQASREWEESERKMAQMASYKFNRGEGVLAMRMSLMETLDESLRRPGTPS